MRLFDIDPAATDKLVANLRHSGLQMVRLPQHAPRRCDGADIVTTVTADKTNATIITPDMLEPGMHVNAVGGDCPGKTELHPTCCAPRVFVEYEPQTRIEGDLQQMPADFAVTELWQVLQGQAGRTTRRQVTVFDSVGFALEDYSALRYMRDARSTGHRADLALVPCCPTPRTCSA
jgi:ornithine cyclodeaminase